ncbi:ABC transporter substrate-binding protein [Pseudonocardia kunmingensis]|uniref:Carbohydrate ABC transporter substrate-binding protein (CUT1 family) n=1 Tax=Pseudonocardia kunmingensis TaxID=630975 RepID=A0A543DIP8_9PSEU|nr:sugar ABC transporter substrate-binding protein [Pseudonocardia kunmingensis]TQM09202.1 carbohydrate ABC transporter substrate-binding protein (CUT1 family) [Pseudonocardia kunmingensis]
MKTIRKRVLAAAAAAGLAVALAACGSGGGGGSSTADGRTTLVWNMWSGSTAEVEAWNHLSEMVTAAHPDITLEFQTSSFNDYWTKLAAQASGGDAGCILGVQSYRAPGIAPLLTPLDDLLAGAGVNAADFDPAIWEALRVDGEQLAVPYDFGPLVMFYNADRFREAGVPVPATDWTVDDFLAAAQTLTGGGKHGFAVYPTIDSVIPWSLSLEGAEPVNAEGELELTQPGFAAAVQWYTDLVTQRKVAPQVVASSDPTPALSSFIAGDAAMVIDGPWQLVNVVDQAAFEVGVATIPAGPSGSHSQVAGSGFGISQTCEEPEAALRAISVLTGPEALQYLAEQGRAFPARTAQQEAWYSPELAGAKEGLQAAIANGVPAPATENYTQVSQLFQQYGVEAVNGQQAVPEFLSTVQQQAG